MRSPEQASEFFRRELPNGLELLRQMVEINSFTDNPDGVNRLGRLTAAAFEPLGFAAEFVPSTNPRWGHHLVLTREGRSRRNLAMISHLDTVFPPEEEARNNFRWQPEGNRIYGPGTQDIKGGTVMIWLLLSALRTCEPRVFEELSWRLIWNSSEEQFSPDFAEVCRTRFNEETLAALVFEAEGRREQEGLVVFARKGRASWRATVNGRASHAGSKHAQGANAITQLAKVVQEIEALTDYRRDLTFNTGMIRGGTVLNRVPHEAVAEGEFRAFTPEVYNSAKARLLSLNGPGALRSPADGYACSVKVEVLTECRPWPQNPATDRLLEIWKQAGATLGIAVGGEARGGLSDGNLIWDLVPTLDGLGPWGDNDHCSERSADGSKLPEFVEISSFVPKARVNFEAILALADTPALNR